MCKFYYIYITFLPSFLLSFLLLTMPLLWKRVKGTKISQLFSDHLESQRRQRGHLVVETGFSTSLVDLFVKNRDRLKKPNSFTKKKKKKKEKDQIMDTNSSLVFPSSVSPSRSPLILRAPCSSPYQSPLAAATTAAAAVHGGWKETDERPNAKGVFGALLWIFFVVVIALWTKRFAVGLTMSAFLLFFVEFIGKKTYRFFEPCSGGKRRLRLSMQSIFQVNAIRFFRRNESFDEKFHEEEEEEEKQKLGSHDNSNPYCEVIQIDSEPMLMLDGCNQERLLPPPDISEPKKKGKRSKMKSKIKRLFKVSSSKKEKKNHLETEERIFPILDEEKKDPNQNLQQKSISRTCTRMSSSSSLTSNTTTTTTTQEEDEISTICSSTTDEEKNLDGIVTGEEDRNWRRMVIISVIMCIIVLVGLTIGGKVLAMALMVIWFLMLKSREILRRYIKQQHTY